MLTFTIVAFILSEYNNVNSKQIDRTSWQTNLIALCADCLNFRYEMSFLSQQNNIYYHEMMHFTLLTMKWLHKLRDTLIRM